MMSYAVKQDHTLPNSIGGYTVERQLARGGMGSVFLVRGLGPGGVARRFALKSIHPHIAEDPYLREMFIDEARLLAQLAHPAVSRVVDYGEENDSAYIVMEYLEGLPLDVFTDHLERCSVMRREPRYFQMVARVMANLLEGLHAAHEVTSLDGKPLRVVHRDISPQNLFLCFDGTQRVLDFGIASAAEQLRLTDVGSVKGKYPYMAPEQARGQEVDRRADLWAMGVVLWELLSGERAFGPHMSRREIMRTSLKGLPSTREIDPRVPEGLDAVAMRAVQVPLDRRYRTAREMARELEFWLGNCGDSVPAADVGEWVRRTAAVLQGNLQSHTMRNPSYSSTTLPREDIVEEPTSAARSGGGRPFQGARATTPGSRGRGAGRGRAIHGPWGGAPAGTHQRPSLLSSTPTRARGRVRRWATNKVGLLSTTGMAATLLLLAGLVAREDYGPRILVAHRPSPQESPNAPQRTPRAPAPAAASSLRASLEVQQLRGIPIEAEEVEATAGSEPRVAAERDVESTEALSEAPTEPSSRAASEPPTQERRARRDGAPKRRTRTQGATPATDEPALPAPPTGRVHIETLGGEGALVYRGGVLLGRTPVDLQLPAGEQHLEVAASPDAPRTAVRVQVMPGMRVRVRAAVQ